MLQEPIIEIILEDSTMSPEEIKKIISDSKSEINKLNQIIIEIQNSCKHNDIEVKNVSTSVPTFRKVCKDCEKIVGYLSPKDISNL